MRSLSFKLIVAFIVTSVAGIAIAAAILRSSVEREFNSYVINQERACFVGEASAYYAGAGSWKGFDTWLHNRAQRQNPPPGAQQTEGGYGPPQQRFLLVDSTGTVVVPLGKYTAGQKLAPAEIERGTPVISVNGQMVGRAITLDWADSRNSAEMRYLAHTDMALGTAAAVMLGVALLLGIFFARVISRPVRELTTATQRIAAGEYQQQVPVRSRDELGMLATQFNHMSADLAQAIASRRQMTADVAHDLRTPLTVIAGYLEALRDQVLAPTPARFATMYDETRLLLRLVDDLHTLSLADAGELPITRKEVSPHQLLDRVAETYRHAAEQQGIALLVEAQGELPAIRVDSEQIARALSNLVSNALRYTPAGGRVMLSGQAAKDMVQLTVTDTGIGIAPEHLPGVFERFYRADSSRQSATGGSGLGLAIVKSIVESHGGQLSVISKPGAGTAFTIVLAT